MAVNLGAWVLILALMVASAAGASWIFLRLGADVLDKARVLAEQSESTAEVHAQTATAAPESEPYLARVSKPGEPVYGNPAWVRYPAPQYPDMAVQAGVAQGVVELYCEVLAEGLLGACEVLSETPPGLGFADQALLSLRDARMRPATIDGRPTDSKVRFAVRFQLE